MYINQIKLHVAVADPETGFGEAKRPSFYDLFLRVRNNSFFIGGGDTVGDFQLVFI